MMSAKPLIGVENYYAITNQEELRQRYNSVWVVMREPPEGMPVRFLHVPVLAPTPELLLWFQQHKECIYRNPEMFEEDYAPRYIRELLDSQAALNELLLLLSSVRKGKRIALVCTCYHEELCHRSILAGILQGVAPDIEMKASRDYIKYWTRLVNMDCSM